MSATHTLISTTTFEPIFQEAPHLQALLALCRSENIQIHLVGGAIRDLLYRGTLSKDLDFVVPTQHAKALATEISEQLHGKCLCLDERYQIYRVILFPELEMLDIAGCIGKDIHEDLLRRDLTINAMAYDFETRLILDPTDGQADLRQGIIRMVNETNLLEDPLRLLRIFRIGAELGFMEIDPKTLESVARHGDKLMHVAVERIHYELMKMFSTPKCFRHVRLMGDTGLLEYIFPELSPTHQVPANQFHHLNLFDHTLELLNQAEIHFEDLPTDIQTHLSSPFNPFIKHIALVRLACLFHDIGKPATMAYDPEIDRYKFYGHEEVSEELTYGIAVRMRWGKEMTHIVADLSRWHLYPGDVLRPEVSEKGYRKFFRRIGSILPEMILLSIADRFSAQGPALTPGELETSKAGLLKLWDRYQAFQTTEIPVPKLLSGQEIMELLDLPPGPRVGQILVEISETFQNGELNTKQEAIAWLQNRYGDTNA
jgi:putative nucleotidyltransferase with HDIG domain